MSLNAKLLPNINQIQQYVEKWITTVLFQECKDVLRGATSRSLTTFTGSSRKKHVASSDCCVHCSAHTFGWLDDEGGSGCGSSGGNDLL